MSTENCKNCNAPFKNSIMYKNEVYSALRTELINEYHPTPSDQYCTKCGPKLFDTYTVNLLNERKKLSTAVDDYVSKIPVISLQSPYEWT